MSKTSTSTTSRISSYVLMVVFVTLLLSFVALFGAFLYFDTNETAAWGLLLFGFGGVALSTYVLVQTRRRLMKVRIDTAPVNTTIGCTKCGFKTMREYQRGDYIFKESDKCEKCGNQMMITAIYKEVSEKEKERSRF